MPPLSPAAGCRLPVLRIGNPDVKSFFMQIVTTHTNTDFDALASSIAVTILYPDTLVVAPGNLNANVKAFLSIHKNLFPTIRPKDVDFDRVERLIVVDVNRWERLDRMDPLRDRAGLEIWLWDHHMDDGNLRPTWSCQEAKGATVTLLVRRLKEERKILTPIQATLLLAGIYEDTGNLTFPSTTAEDAYAAAYLLERRADLAVLNTFLKPAYGEKQKDVLFHMLQSAKRYHINGHPVSISRQQIEGHVDNLAVVVHMYREILNVDAAFGIFTEEGKDRCVVIGRGSTDGLDIGEIMRKLGGGGHQGAGSAMLRSADPQQVTRSIKELIRSDQQAAAKVSDLMSFPVISVSSDASMRETAMILRDKGCTGVPVVDGEKLVGMISRSDFRKLKGEKQVTLPVKAFMCTKVRTIAPGKSATDAARLMVKYDIGRLPVVADGRMIGIMTRSDAMLYLYDLLPD